MGEERVGRLSCKGRMLPTRILAQANGASPKVPDGRKSVNDIMSCLYILSITDQVEV